MIPTAYDLVRAAAERTPAQDAIVDWQGNRSVTYTRLVEDIDAVAGNLAHLGVQHGDFVAIVPPDTVEHIVAIFAVGRLGAVAALMSTRLEPATIAELIHRGGIGHVIVPAWQHLVDGLAGHVPGTQILTVGGPVGARELRFTRSAAYSLPYYRATDPEAPELVFYTSGTTSVPKGVVLSHRTVLPRVAIMATQGNLRFGSQNRSVGLLPLSHMMGMFGTLLPALAFNGTYFTCPRWDAAATVELIARKQLTFLVASPTHLYDLVHAPGCTQAALASLEAVNHTGAPMPPTLLDELSELVNAPIGQLYGSTEMMNSLYADRQNHDLPQLLRPGFLSNVRVVHPDGGVHDVVAPGEIGELVVSMDAPGTFNGYLHQPEATEQKVQHGWYRTGDAVRCLDDGRFELKGRCDDMILSGGENIYPQEVEDVLVRHPNIADVAVVGVAHPRWGEVTVACIQTDQFRPTTDSLDALCRNSELANYKRPRHYLFIDALPRNAINKVLRYDLATWATERLAEADGLHSDPTQGSDR